MKALFQGYYASPQSDTYCLVPATTYFQVVAWLCEHRTQETLFRSGTLLRCLPDGTQTLAGYITEDSCVLVTRTMVDFGCPIAIAPHPIHTVKAAIASLIS